MKEKIEKEYLEEADFMHYKKICPRCASEKIVRTSLFFDKYMCKKCGLKRNFNGFIELDW